MKLLLRVGRETEGVSDKMILGVIVVSRRLAFLSLPQRGRPCTL